MIYEWMPAFLDELSKVAEFTEEGKKQLQASAVLGGIGAAGAPASGLVVNRIKDGRWIPAGAGTKRWLAGTAVGGAISGGLLGALTGKVRDKMLGPPAAPVLPTQPAQQATVP